MRSVATVAGLVLLTSLSAVTTLLAGCAVHEAGHAAVGTAMGYEVVSIEVCPGAASVGWAPSDLAPIDSTVEAWAGGIIAAGVLAAAYGLVFVLPRRPARSAVWWWAGLPIPALAAGEFVVGVMEGATQGRYGQVISSAPLVWIPLLGLAVLGGGAVHVALWRRPRSGDRPEPRPV